MVVRCIDNLRGFTQTRPPLIVFLICIGGFSVILVTLAYYVKVSELSDPDITDDWNAFLQNFADLEFCVYGNLSEYSAVTSSKMETTTTGRGPHSRERRDSHRMTFTPTENTSVSVQMAVEFQPTPEFMTGVNNLTHLTTSVLGHELGLTGFAGDEYVNMTLELPRDTNFTSCWSNTHCTSVTIITCVTLLAPVGLFPSTKKPVCNSTIDNSMTTDHWAHLGLRKLEPACSRKPMVKLSHQLDRTLTMMLSLHDRSVINLHLMHTSYFLFVMVITLFCYALVKGRPNKIIKGSQHSDKVPLQA